LALWGANPQPKACQATPEEHKLSNTLLGFSATASQVFDTSAQKTTNLIGSYEDLGTCNTNSQSLSKHAQFAAGTSPTSARVSPKKDNEARLRYISLGSPVKPTYGLAPESEGPTSVQAWKYKSPVIAEDGATLLNTLVHKTSTSPQAGMNDFSRGNAHPTRTRLTEKSVSDAPLPSVSRGKKSPAIIEHPQEADSPANTSCFTHNLSLPFGHWK